MLEFFRGKEGNGLLEPFLRAYVSERELREEERWKAAARFAVQVTYWPITGKWGQERIEEALEPSLRPGGWFFMETRVSLGTRRSGCQWFPERRTRR